MTDLKKLKTLAEAATPGPWDDYREQGILPSLFSYEELSNGQRKLVEYIGHAQKEENRQFIAAANPEAVLGLIARIEKLEAALQSISNHASDPFAWWVREAREALKEETP